MSATELASDDEGSLDPSRRGLVRPIDYARRFRMLDHVFGLRTNIATSGEVIDRLLSPFRVPGIAMGIRCYELLQTGSADSADRPYEIHSPGEQIGRVSSPGLLLDWLIGDATGRAVASTTEFIAIHASAASIDREAIVFPAPRKHGKTTTVAALVRAGYDFLTDEVALISVRDGLVHPFPRPLSISPSSMAVLPGLKGTLPHGYELLRHFDYHVAPDDLRPRCISEAVAVRAIVFPSYSDGAATRLERLPRADALMGLVRSCFNFPAQRGTAMQVLAPIVRGAACYRLSIGDLDEAVALIDSLYEEGAADAGTSPA